MKRRAPFLIACAAGVAVGSAVGVLLAVFPVDVWRDLVAPVLVGCVIGLALGWIRWSLFHAAEVRRDQAALEAFVRDWVGRQFEEDDEDEEVIH